MSLPEKFRSPRRRSSSYVQRYIYASNCEVERRRLWLELQGTQAAYSHIDMPWIVAGDFNATLSSGEHSRGCLTSSVGDCILTDLTHSGVIFTLWNNQEAGPIGNKLDRALINGPWLQTFPQSSCHFEAGGYQITQDVWCVSLV